MTGKTKITKYFGILCVTALVSVLLLVGNPTPGKADDTAATATSTATTAPTATTPLPTPIFTDWSGNFVVKAGVPFLWLRYQPSSYGDVITTIYPGRVFVASGSRVWDGVQWWGWVTLSPTHSTGWVELALIERVTVVPPTVTPPPSAGLEAWNTSMIVQVKDGISFVWLRADASSYAGVLVTVPTRGTMLISSNTAQHDDRQWWWQVKHLATGITGWVEQASLVVVSGVTVTPNPVPTAAPWIISGIVRVRSEVPFSWLRRYYSSWSSPVYTANSGTWLQLIAAPQYDGIQWWWKVKVPNTAVSGWVEQKSLELPAGVG